jgi:hypothetical protein
LPKGAFVCEYAGEILTSTELHERAVENMQNDRYVHPILLDAGWCSELKDEEALCLDGSFYGNVGRFINHRCALALCGHFYYEFLIDNIKYETYNLSYQIYFSVCNNHPPSCRCCDANLAVIPVEVETPDHHYYHVSAMLDNFIHFGL